MEGEGWVGEGGERVAWCRGRGAQALKGIKLLRFL